MPIRLRPFDLATLDAVSVDAYAIFVAEDERPLFGLGGLIDWRLAGGLSQHLRHALLEGKARESFLTTTGGLVPGRRLFAFGLGRGANVTQEIFTTMAAQAAAALQRAKVASLAVGLPERPGPAASARILVNALDPLAGLDVSLFGPLPEMSAALPELTPRKTG
jgi:hypothetical protein